MPTKKKAGGRKRGDEADRAELEMLRKQVEEQRQALEAEEARKEQENQGKRQVSSRRQRTLVRWDVDTDIRLLLAIQYVCNKTGVKIPWKDAAEVMGEKFTEGAIVQHLSKLRSKREEQDKPNPPPLKRAANGNHKGDAGKKKGSPKQDPAPSTRGGKRRRRDQSDGSEDDVYTLKKKQFSKNKKKDKVFVAPKLREKREETESDDSQKLLCVGAEWLRDFAGDDREVDNESATSEEKDNSAESSEATTLEAKKSKMVTLKVGRERLASVDPYLGTSATFREPVTPTNQARVVTNMPPRRQFYYPNMNADTSAPFSTGVSIPFPSNGPSPFDIANRFPNGIPEAGPGAAPSSVSGGVTTFDGITHTAAYSHFDVAPELQFANEYTGQGMVPVTSYFETSGFGNQFLSDSEMFANLPDVEPPRYFGYEGEDTKEF
ncbi:unnamed protein product [Penicillium nalgiovense]|uniref:Uncharacterized protein n=1 Tax=Penicillium nalgiovense TaxID=60175 RepID=A0A9W4HEX1_PENNA|nr:unnamed protein product [Penicillium nalgiovense]CAG7951199.1 unnamed protein product [Penicillium nalgiovense]CAG7963632.1 unnamed protein product [Penicillium nalgiovense]CAG7964028.1 unnamed protein product [Penicillium nalgiovense]CAG7991508.1 unnamed protein product [Penicillium nalgiovense]